MNIRIASLLFLAPCLLAACGSAATEEPMTRGNVILADANNYTSVSTLMPPTVETASGADLTVCWDAVKKDILCHDLTNTNDIDNVGFLSIPNMDQATVSNKLAAGQLTEKYVKIYRDYNVSQTPTSTCAQLSKFVLGASTLMPATDYVESTSSTYMLLFATGTTPGVGARTMMFIKPTATSSTTMVAAPDGCSTDILDFDATFGQSIAISATDNTKWLVDWADVTKDSFKNPVPSSGIDRVIVGFYQGKDRTAVEQGFLDIETTATALYEVNVTPGKKVVNLADAKLRGGTTAFPGFTETNGTWMVAVMCGKCQLPAPVVLTVLTPQ
jgi:hypothetical protein